jgi:hypothetical protein
VIQAECEALHADFSPMYWCTRQAIAARSPGVMSNERAKLYLLRGEQLAREVDEKRINSLDAKVLWQELFVSLKAANDQEAMAAAAAMAKGLEAARLAYQPPPVPQGPALVNPAPTRGPTAVTCTSTRDGFGTVQTVCK